MGAPSSAVLPEIFIQSVEHNEIYQVLRKHDILSCFRYVDGTLIMCDEKKTNIDSVLTKFNNQLRTCNLRQKREAIRK
jgi:hypothetical protein